jgi:hypothetical protein
MGRQERRQAIESLQNARDGTVVISYITSTRQNQEAQWG